MVKGRRGVRLSLKGPHCKENIPLFRAFTIRSATAFIALLACALPLAAGQDGTIDSPRALTPVAQVVDAPIDEMSGIVKSRRYPDTYWVHNDSGDVARIFAIHANGSVIMPPWIGSEFYVGATPVEGKKPYPGIQIAPATNYDWEDIAYDGDKLYLSDMGNNGNARRDLGIYVVNEPNPVGVTATKPLRWLPIAYPDQTDFPPKDWFFDCEAIFVWKGKVHFLTKHRAMGQINIPATGTNLYRLDTEYTDKMNVLKKLDVASDLGGWITAADVSPDGKTLAVLCHAPIASVWLFELGKSGDKLLSGKARRLVLTGAKQCEAICFDDNDKLIVTNEDRDIFRLSAADFRPAQVPGK